jgi:hypothetical protein
MRLLSRWHVPSSGSGDAFRYRVWKVTALGAGTGAALLARRTALAVWRTARHEEPPTDPAARGVSWGDAMAWTIAVAIGAAIARVVAQRGAAAAWTAATGNAPPTPPD